MYESLWFYCDYFIGVFIGISFLDLNGRAYKMHPVWINITVLLFRKNKESHTRPGSSLCALPPLIFTVARRNALTVLTIPRSAQKQKIIYLFIFVGCFFFVLSWSSHCDRGDVFGSGLWNETDKTQITNYIFCLYASSMLYRCMYIVYTWICICDGCDALYDDYM